MEVESSKQKKRIHVNAASLVDLKAALFRKKQEVKQSGAASNKLPSKNVSEKTSSIWRKQSKKTTRKEGGANSSKTAPRSHDLTPEEETDFARSRAALEAKAAMYEKLSRGDDLPSSSDEDDDNPRIMVDFQRKICEQVSREQRLKSNSKVDESRVQATEGYDTAAESGGDEWVDYTDSLGRSRRCLKKDLPQMQLIDRQMETNRETRSSGSSSPDLLSEDMRRERERQKWEEEAYREAVEGEYGEEVEDGKTKETSVHYQTIRHDEIRTHGVGYYTFDVDEEKREEQMKALNKLREETKDQRTKREKLKEKRKAIMEAKLAKIRQRKMKNKGDTEESKEMTLSAGIAEFDFEKGTLKEPSPNGTKVPPPPPAASKEPELLEDLIQKQVSEAREKAEEEERMKHKRPWDRGKVVDPIRKQKKELQEERLTEFAPPLSYNKKSKLNTTSGISTGSQSQSPDSFTNNSTDTAHQQQQQTQPYPYYCPQPYPYYMYMYPNFIYPPQPNLPPPPPPPPPSSS